MQWLCKVGPEMCSGRLASYCKASLVELIVEKKQKKKKNAFGF